MKKSVVEPPKSKEATEAKGATSRPQEQKNTGKTSLKTGDTKTSKAGDTGKSGQALAKVATAKAAKPQGKQSTAPQGQPEAGSLQVPVNDRTYIILGFAILLLSLGTFTIWAAFAPLSSAVIAPGEVVVDSYRKSIQHLEGGLVENIFVRNGDLVQAGDPLVQLDETSWLGESESNRKRMFSTLVQLERLRSEQMLAGEMVYSQEVLEAAKNDKDLAAVLEQNRQLHKARVAAHRQEQQALKSRAAQAREQTEGLKEQQSIVNQQIALLEKEYEAYTTLLNERLGDGQRARELNRQILTSKNEAARLQSEIARTELVAAEYSVQLSNNRQNYLKDIGERIQAAQADYFDTQERYRISQDRLKRATIRAPESGYIVGLQVHTIGSVARPGATLMDLVPGQDKFVVETKVATNDINSIHQGQKADIRFSAFNQRTTKVIEGEVINISADRLINENTGEPYYLTRIKVTEKGKQDMSDEMNLIPGMPAEVMIRREDRTLFSYLLKPIADSFARSFREK
ncbi:HlyD family type I secretion periplasmic adaptor subunit [Oceanospirillum linum]|uniref:HlyD family type I secretion periplasmic adaptor subunit n=1 Tax=Oceanospirillum linum TaxID=966 RepID=UPI00089F4DB8|nr:HlyD family type I secretion periplasmic adaptor subunit [Oceanospirillum linum]SEF70080.1 membrane fusion protein, epimerase transport system [Oleiphilus messinensis]SMP15207.1 membrane fusion protein, epimerase transport system [Oceanospirillum linum]